MIYIDALVDSHGNGLMPEQERYPDAMKTMQILLSILEDMISKGLMPERKEHHGAFHSIQVIFAGMRGHKW